MIWYMAITENVYVGTSLYLKEFCDRFDMRTKFKTCVDPETNSIKTERYTFLSNKRVNNLYTSVRIFLHENCIRKHSNQMCIKIDMMKNKNLITKFVL